jgi:hypothetical protein
MYRIFILFSLLLIAGCSNNEKVTVKYIDNDPLFFDYKVWAEEDRDYVTIILQYRYDGRNGLTRELKDPSSVDFDSTRLEVDSSRMSGYFYEIEKPLDSFAGKHVITYTDAYGKLYKEEFEFNPFFLKSELPDIIRRGDLIIQLEGIKPEDLIRVIALDTVFKSKGINEVDTVKNGLVTVTADRLRNLVNGKIHLELYKEEEWQLKNATTAGGILSISYGLKREFELTD